MGQGGYKIDDQEGIYFITFSVVGWVDVFTRPEYKDIFVESLKYCQKEKQLNIHAWCLMTNHVHLMVSSETGELSAILRDLKRHTSREVLKAITNNVQESRREWMIKIFQNAGEKNSRNEKFQFWQQDNQPKEIITMKFGEQKLDYIHNNPVVAEIVDVPEAYLYSSARDYFGEKGLIGIDFLY